MAQMNPFNRGPQAKSQIGAAVCALFIRTVAVRASVRVSDV